RGSAGRRGSTGTNATTCRSRSRPCPPRRCESRAAPRRARCRRRSCRRRRPARPPARPPSPRGPWRACDVRTLFRSSAFLRLGPRAGTVVGFVREREENVMPAGNGRRVAVVAGRRTPFCRSGTALKDVRAVDLARFVARELLERTDLAGAEVDAVIFGQVVPSALVPNVAREVSLLPQFPKEIPA